MRWDKSLHAIVKQLGLIFICLVILLSFALPVPADDTLTVGVPVDRCPMFYQDPDTGEIEGIGVDLMSAAAKEAGYTANFVLVKEETMKAALDNPEYDVVMPFGSAITSASGKPSIVSENLLQTPFTLVTVDRRVLPSLNELRVGMLKSLGGVAETVKQLYPGIEIVFYDTMDDSVKALRSGEIDALMHNSYVWSYVLQKPSYKDLKVQPTAMFSMDFRAGALDTPEGREIISHLNSGIDKLDDTFCQAVILDYTNRQLYRYDFFDYLYQYGLFLILIVLLAAFVILITVQRWKAYRRHQEERMRDLMEHDPLTGVLNLNGFRKRVEELLQAHPEIHYLLSYNNISNFKYINDSLGRSAGDELLRFWAEKSKENLSDVEAIGRLYADRFLVLRRIEEEKQMRVDEVNVLGPVRNYFLDRGKGNQVQICSGVYALTPVDYQQIDVDRMLDYARVAEKRLRESQKEGLEFYNPEQWEKGRRSAEIIGHLSTAVSSGEIQVWYQPQVDFGTRKIVGAEALCRWNHAVLGWISPAEFIPALEEAGLIFDLDCFVWEKVCQDLQRWNQEGEHRSVSVNLSRSDLVKDRNIPGLFYDLIRKYELAADQLRIEITETAFVDNPDLLIQTTVDLREYGFLVEMDDFGSGYSSLHMLKEVPVDRIKLDLHFLSGKGELERGRIIVSHMIQMVKSLGMSLIAEGVENEKQAEFLQSRGCSEMQGFYFHKPMPVEEFEQICKGNKPEQAWKD